MRNHCVRLGFVCWGVVLVAVGTMAQAGGPDPPLMSLKAVKINPTCTAPPSMLNELCAGDRQCDSSNNSFDGRCGGDITPSNTVSVNPGDIVIAEAFASNWSPSAQRLRAYQFHVRSDGYFSGGGTLRPLGWDRPIVDILCSKGPCPPQFPICLPTGVCAGVNHNTDTAFMDARLFEGDHALAGCQVLGSIDTSEIGYRYGNVVAGSLSCTETYADPPKYCGTLGLKLGLDACGTFTLNFVPAPKLEIDNTVLVDLDNMKIGPLDLEGLTLEVGGPLCPCRIVGSTPSNCTIDARQPSEPDGISPQGWSSIALEFDNPCESCEFEDDDFSIREITRGNPSIAGKQCTDQNILTVTFGEPISEDKWTCVKYLETNQEVCLGFLPGDSDGDQRADETDVVHLLDCLSGDVSLSCADHQCDTDRSGRCTPADILREIDLLGGAEEYRAWLGEELPGFAGCP